MGFAVVTGANCTCTFGSAPSTLSATSQTKCLVDGKPAATIMDCQMSNLTPFGMCSSLANPAVASATAAALGVLTPQPCSLIPAGTWITSNTKVIAGGKPALGNDGKLTCAMGAGMISITSPGQTKINL